MEIAAAIFITAIIAPLYFNALDKMERRISDTWPDSWAKRIMLLRFKSCPSAKEREAGR